LVASEFGEGRQSDANAIRRDARFPRDVLI
jgi:hypothetical protein